MLQRLAALLRRRPAPPPAPVEPGVDAEPPRGGARDLAGPARIAYAPERDGDPDPGEVVWCWVPYEENDGRGKDRPVIAMGYAGDAGDLLAVMLSSQDHHAGDRDWVAVGTGDWDRERRASYARVDRPFSVPAGAVRREGGTLPRPRFDDVAQELRQRYGFS